MVLEEKKTREKLVEELGVCFEKNRQLPPLAARIYVLLMLSPRSGYSFDEVVELSQASKSSVSTNVNLLLSNGSVEYYTKPGDRKRYFRLSKDYLKVGLKKNRDRVAEELKILQKIDQYNKVFNLPKYEKHKDFRELYHNYLEQQYHSLEHIIDKMNQIEN